jgi:PhzF family phenazine biosynthesis protein
MPRTPFFQIDAFTRQRFRGNPAAVLVLETYPDAATMLAIAAENNLAETAFLVPDGARYHLRWFTPRLEVPLCGHATLASAAVVLERLTPERDTVSFETLSGPLHVSRHDDIYRLDLPARPSEPIEVTDTISRALGAEPAQLWVNRFNYMAVYDDAEAVRALEPDMAAVAALDRLGVIATAPGGYGGDHDMVSRYFAPAKGIPEDPVTGAAHCTLTPYWSARLGKRELRAHQASPRGGEMTCRLAGDRVELEGACVFVIEGQMSI